MSNISDDPLYFAKNVPGAGKGMRTVFDPEDNSQSGDETDYQLVEDPAEPKHRKKTLLNEVTPANLASGNPGEVRQVRPMSPNRGGMNTESRPCHYANRDQGHPRASHFFYAPGSEVPYPLCPLHHTIEMEHLAKWRASNPDTIVPPSRPIVTGHDVVEHANKEKQMKDDISALSTSFMVFHHGVSPEAPEAVFGQETPYAGPGRTPGTTAPTPPETRTPEFKERALDAALRRAREGNGGRTEKELTEIGKAEEARRDYSKNYVKDDSGKLTRFYQPLGEAAKGKRKPIGQGNYVKPQNAAPGQAPIEKVMAVAKEAKSHGTHLDKDIWHAIIENHGDGVITPAHVVEHVKGREKQKSVKPAPLTPLPIGGLGAYDTYLKTLGEAAEDKPEQHEENQSELWGYRASRSDAFGSDF
jgi:hypothetical protein